MMPNDSNWWSPGDKIQPVDFWVVEILRKDSHAMNYLLLSAGSESKR
jgi:hypothetical protein